MVSIRKYNTSLRGIMGEGAGACQDRVHILLFGISFSDRYQGPCLTLHLLQRNALPELLQVDLGLGLLLFGSCLLASGARAPEKA